MKRLPQERTSSAATLAGKSADLVHPRTLVDRYEDMRRMPAQSGLSSVVIESSLVARTSAFDADLLFEVFLL
jgi:hypothetical protein